MLKTNIIQVKKNRGLEAEIKLSFNFKTLINNAPKRVDKNKALYLRSIIIYIECGRTTRYKNNIVLKANLIFYLN